MLLKIKTHIINPTSLVDKKKSAILWHLDKNVVVEAARKIKILVLELQCPKKVLFSSKKYFLEWLQAVL